MHNAASWAIWVPAMPSTLVATDSRDAVAKDGRQSYVLVGDIAVIQISGIMMKDGGYHRSTSTISIRRQIRDAVADPMVAGIMMVMDTPGGSVSGTEELRADVEAAGKMKPLHAYVEDMCCSAGMWVASAASRITSTTSAVTGSIGVYQVVYDFSGAAKSLGIKATRIASGPYKGAGAPGTEITQEQIDNWQAMVDEIHDQFVGVIAAGRNLSVEAVRKIADGRVFTAEKAMSHGLIDGVGSFEQAMQFLSQSKESRMMSKEDVESLGSPMSLGLMSEEASHPTGEQPAALEIEEPAAASVVEIPEEPKTEIVATIEVRSATLAELKACCPGASSDFILSQVEAEATSEQAQTAFIRQLASENQQLREENARYAASASPAAEDIGNSAVESTGDIPAQLATAQWKSAIESAAAAMVAAGMSTSAAKAAATSKVAKENPRLREEFLAEYRQRQFS